MARMNLCRAVVLSAVSRSLSSLSPIEEAVQQPNTLVDLLHSERTPFHPTLTPRETLRHALPFTHTNPGRNRQTPLPLMSSLCTILTLHPLLPELHHHIPLALTLPTSPQPRTPRIEPRILIQRHEAPAIPLADYVPAAPTMVPPEPEGEGLGAEAAGGSQAVGFPVCGSRGTVNSWEGGEKEGVGGGAGEVAAEGFEV